MTKQCKYIDKNRKEGKCNNYYCSHGKKKTTIKCRLTEWKSKIGVCPYDKTIFSPSRKILKLIKNNKQKRLEI